MAFRCFNVTIDSDLSGAIPTPILSDRKPIRQLIIQNPTGNDTIYVGNADVTADNYGYAIAAGAAANVIGPFSGDAPCHTGEVYILGTADEVCHVILITH
jgi:hypothetical protein